jgi:hypothetical protein
MTLIQPWDQRFGLLGNIGGRARGGWRPSMICAELAVNLTAGGDCQIVVHTPTIRAVD